MTKPALFLPSLRDALTMLPRVVSEAWWIFLVIHFGRAISSELFSYAAQMIQAQGREDLGSMALTISLQFAFEMSWSTIWLFITVRIARHQLMPAADFHRSPWADFQQLWIEGLRVMAAILWRVPLLIFPALIEIVRLSFVPHAVLLSPRYERGEIDALDQSRQITKGHFFALSGAWTAFFVLSSLPMVLVRGSMGQWFWERPFGFASETLLTLFINLIFEIFLVALFLRLSMIETFAAKDAAEN